MDSLLHAIPVNGVYLPDFPWRCRYPRDEWIIAPKNTVTFFWICNLKTEPEAKKIKKESKIDTSDVKTEHQTKIIKKEKKMGKNKANDSVNSNSVDEVEETVDSSVQATKSKKSKQNNVNAQNSKGFNANKKKNESLDDKIELKVGKKNKFANQKERR